MFDCFLLRRLQNVDVMKTKKKSIVKMVRNNVQQNSTMKVKRVRKDQPKMHIVNPLVLEPRSLSVITSIGSPEPDIMENNNNTSLNVNNKDSISPETNSTFLSSQSQRQKSRNSATITPRSQLGKSNETMQPILHYTTYKPCCSNINTNQPLKRCGFLQNQIYPGQPSGNSQNSNQPSTSDVSLLQRTNRPICQNTYSIQKNSSSDNHGRKCNCCGYRCPFCCCLALIIGLPLLLAGIASLVIVFSLPKTESTITIMNTPISSSTSITTSTSTSITLTTASTTSLVTTVTTTSNPCTSTWNNIILNNICTNCPNINPYQQYSYTYVAISNITRVTFAFREDIGYFALDAVSIRSSLAPSVEILVNGGFETGNLSSWLYCNPSGSSYAGTVKSNANNFYALGVTYQSYSGNYFYLDGAVGKADYLSQTFSTQIGETYNLSFWLYNQGTGSNNIANVIFSV